VIVAVGNYTGFACPACHRSSPPVTDEDYDAYFRGRHWTCPHCPHQSSLWKLIGELVRNEHPLTPGAVGLGLATTSLGHFPLRADEWLTIDLSAMGVPPEADVISVVMTPGAAVFPLAHMQQTRPGPVPHAFSLFGKSLELDATEAIVNLMCIWFSPGQDPTLQPLVAAVEACTNARFREAVVPASVAVEDKLGAALYMHYSQFAGRKTVDEFLSNGATFGYQLNPLLRSLMALVGAPELPTEVASGLSQLRTLRNKVAHEHREITRASAADVLVAAIFGYRYISLYESMLIRQGTSGL